MTPSWIRGHTYDDVAARLTLHTDGPDIVIPEVYGRHYQAFLDAPSQGQYFHKHLSHRVRQPRVRR